MAFGKPQIIGALKNVSRTRRGKRVEKIAKELPDHKMTELETRKALEGAGVRGSGVKKVMGELTQRPEAPISEERERPGKMETEAMKKPGKTKVAKWMKEVGHVAKGGKAPKTAFGQAVKDDVRIEEARKVDQPMQKTAQPQSDVEEKDKTANTMNAQQRNVQEDALRKRASKKITVLDEEEEREEANVGAAIDKIFGK